MKPDAFITELVERWLATDKARLTLRQNGRAMRGFQWKNLFLPDGTVLRTSYLGMAPDLATLHRRRALDTRR